MVPAAYNQGCPWAIPGMTDRVLVQLRKAGYPHSIVGQAIASLPTSGQTTVNISHPNLKSGSYYIVVKNSFNALETWSAEPVAFTVGVPSDYDFTDKAEKAYGNNMYNITDPASGTDYWCFFSGDVNHDGNIDLIDATQLENDILNFAYGCITTDLNGDGNVDLMDQVIFDINHPGLFIHVKSPLTGGSKPGKSMLERTYQPSTTEVEVSPNPSSTFFNVNYKTQSLNGSVKFHLTDVTNRSVLLVEGQCTGDCVERIELPASVYPGLYLLKIIDNGQTVAVKKIIVAK